jgi:hypothetical protein
LKSLFLVSTLLLNLPIFAKDSSTHDLQWIRDLDDHFSYFTHATNIPEVNAKLQLVEWVNKNGKTKKSIDFRIVWSNKDFCKKYEKEVGTITTATYYVNNQALNFNISCYNRHSAPFSGFKLFLPNIQSN